MTITEPRSTSAAAEFVDFFDRGWRAGAAGAQTLRLCFDEPQLLQRIRDEAHRFAITYHRELRRKRAFKAGLDEVPGVGPKRRRELFDRFRNLKGLRAANVEALNSCSAYRISETSNAFTSSGVASVPRSM